MSRSMTVAALSTCLTLIWAGQGFAQTRGSRAAAPGSAASNRDDAARAKKMAEMDAWLGRLVGHFDVTAKSTVPPAMGVCIGFTDNHPGAQCNERMDFDKPPPIYRGVADCRPVDATHGVSCEFAWKLVWPPFTDNLPTMMLVGVDPENLAIRFLLVNDSGLAIQARGPQKDNRATLERECAIRGTDNCLPTTWSINARPGERPVEILIHVDQQNVPLRKRGMNLDIGVTLVRAKRPAGQDNASLR